MSARAELILALRGNLVTGLQQAGRQFQRTQQLGSRSMAVLNRSVVAASRGMDHLANRYTAIATGAAAAGASRYVIGLERRLTRLGIAANLSDEAVGRLNEQINRTALDPNIRVDSGEILSAIESIVEKTGDLAFAENNIRNIGLAIQATGAGGQAIGELLAEFQKLGETDGSKVLELLDTLNVQGKTGAFTLENLAALGPRVITAYASSVKGMRDTATVMREMGAALQTIRQGTGSSEQAATAFERLLAELQMADKQKLFRKLGVQIFTVGEDGQKALRPINELMTEIIEKTRGDRTILGAFFGDESIRAFNAFKPELIQQYMDVMGDGTQTVQDSARAARDAAGALQNLSTAWRQIADTQLSPAIQGLADGLNGITPDTVRYWGDLGKKVLIVGAGILALRKIFQISRGIAGILGAGRGVGGAGATTGGIAGGGFGGMPLPLPVYVVNRHMSLTPNSWAGGAAGGGAGGAGTAARAGRLARLGRAVGAVGLAGAGGYAVGSIINDQLIEGTRFGDAFGAGIARVLAAFGNRSAQEAIDRNRRTETQLNGTLNIQIDQQGRARVQSYSTDQPGVDMDVYSGLAGAPS